MKHYHLSTELGMLHAEVSPTLEALGEQPWQVRIRSTAGDLLLSCFVEAASGLEAATEAAETVLELKKAHNRTIKIQ